MEERILDTIKSMLGVSDLDEAFDNDILVNINATFSTLYQIGVGEDDGHYFILDGTEKWNDVFKQTDLIDFIKLYTYMKVKLLFDPPTNSSVLESLKAQINEVEYRILLQADPADYFLDTEEDEVKPGKVLSEADITNIWEEIIGSVPGITSGSPMTDEELEAIWEEIIGSLPSISDKTVLTTEEVKEIWKEIMGNVPNIGESTESITGLTDEELDKIWDDIIGKKTDKSTMSDEDIVELWNDIMY